MPDGLLSEGGQPRGRAAELIQILRETGFLAAADLIASDIYLRRRVPDSEPEIDRVVETGVAGAPRTIYRAESDDDIGPPLTDDEVVEVIRAALEEAVVAPFEMLHEVTELSQSMAQAPRAADFPFGHPIPVVQIDESSDIVGWCAPEAFGAAFQFGDRIPIILRWLHGAPDQDGL